MQTAFDFGATNVLALIRNRLRKIFGDMRPRAWRSPVGQLVKSLIGGRTYDAVSLKAYERLVAAYPSWPMLADAMLADVTREISDVTFPEQKAKWLAEALPMLRARAGGYDLEFLADWDVPQALRWLEQLSGVGRKVAASTLNFSTLRRPALVIDTHVLRVFARLGFVAPGTSIENAYDGVMPLLANWTADELSELHVLVKRLGQTICTQQIARCAECPLCELCQATARAQPGNRQGVK
jgi:endonuclease-3